MEIRVLRYFLTVAREENITKAAEILHITQPTLSRQIAQMEEELGVTLFKRGTRHLALTNEGVLLRRRAEDILQLVDKTERELVEHEELIDGTVSIGSGELTAVQVFPEIFKAFKEKYPLVRFDIYTAGADQVIERMQEGITDLGILLEPVDISKFDFLRLPTKEIFGAFMRPDDPLAQKESVTPADLLTQPVMLPHRPGVHGQIVNWFGDVYDDLNVVFTGNMSTNMAIMASQGLGVSVTLEGSMPFLNNDEIVFRPLSPELSSTTVLAWKRHQPYGLATTKFIEFAKCFLSIENDDI